MKRLLRIVLLACLISLVHGILCAQSAADLIGRWEGVHYYGDTTRLYDGTMVVRASTIDSMKMILTIDELQDRKFKGRLHEQFYSNPSSVFFTAAVNGFIKDDKIYFSSFIMTENRMPAGNEWCKPKATGVLVKKGEQFFLHISFETTLTCTIGPAIVERKVAENIIPTPEKPVVAAQQPTRSALPRQSDSTVIIDRFRKRSRSITSTINVQSDSVSINFSDNGIVDGDSISVFLNGRLEAAHISLTRVPYTLNVQFEKGTDEIEVAMFAENVGSVPPNTSLMQVVEGKKTHQVYLSSDTRKNAVVRIRRLR